MQQIIINTDNEGIFPTEREEEQRYAATVGFFDGLHRGHQYLLAQLQEAAEARGLKSLVVTFDGHPRAVLQPSFQPRLLTTLDEKLALIEAAGIDACCVLPFTPELARKTAQEFMRTTLHNSLQTDFLLMGYDHRFGSNGNADLATYAAWGADEEVEVAAAEALYLDGEAISSSLVRRLLTEGDVEQAEEALGRSYAIAGTVVEGKRLGRTIGFPTANLLPGTAERLIPAQGVYAVVVEAQGGHWKAMLNIGRRPTVDNGTNISIEAHLLGFQGSLYGEPLRLHFRHRLRDERKFDSLEALQAQLRKDAERTDALITL